MNKQIDDMVTLMCEERKKHKSCKACKSGNPNENAYCRIEHYAEALYNADYRKASSVAREIFAEIAKFIFSEIPNELMPIYKERDFRDGVIFGKREAFFEVLNHLDNHLRKKYESEGADDEG